MATIFPPSDLLGQVNGINEGLRKNKHLRDLGWFGVLLGAIQFVVVAANTSAWQLLTDPDQRDSLLENWPLLVSLLVFAFSLIAFIRIRGWIKESKAPFRYTCSIADYLVVPPAPEHASFHVSPRLRYDLAERLNERIARLSFLEEALVSEDGGTDGRSHIHVGGELLIRERPDHTWGVEVTARIRMGGRQSPEKLAHPVKFTLGANSGQSGDKVKMISRRGTTDPPPLESKEYEKILERVYFSIATEIYRQIRGDVEQKISLLPTNRLKAVAYLHEAEDYLKSNTLDAYDEAKVLFDTSLRLFLGKRRYLARPARLSQSHSSQLLETTRVRGGASRVRRRRAQRRILVARAEIGYASTLVYRRALAGMSGHRVNSIFEAKPVVDRALESLAEISYEIPGARKVRFDGYVTKALIGHYQNSTNETEAAVKTARSIDPARAESDSRFLFATGLMEIRPRQALPLLRRAVEEDPRFEVAQFELALDMEHVWRMRPELETSVAERMVAEEYMDVLKINPANVRTWTNLGYIYWLLGDHREEALDAFHRGREYKEIRRTTYVAELDHSLARIYAESGDFELAYKHYLSAVSAHIAQGVNHESQTSAQFYFFDFIGEAMLRRFVQFKDKVIEIADTKISKGDRRATRRMCDSVAAFALNDCGEAHRDYYSRMGDPRALDTARALFEEAVARNSHYVMPHFNLYLLKSHQLIREPISSIEENTRDALMHLERVNDLEPRWPDAVLAKVFTSLRAAERAEVNVARIRRETIKEEGTTSKPRGLVGSKRPTAPAALPDDHPDKAEERWLQKTSGIAAQTRQVRWLTPHHWLWEDEAFNWRSLRKPQVWESRWEREIDDLHVRALFSWGAGQLLKRKVGDDDHEVDSETTAQERQLRRLLLHIRDRFWPADFWLLRICRDIPASGVTREQLKDIIGSWLKEDPSAYWALCLMLQEEWTNQDVKGSSPLFTNKEKIDYLVAARAMDALPAKHYRWFGELLMKLGEDEEAIKAYMRAVSVSCDPDLLDKLGKELESLHVRGAAFDAYRRVLRNSSDAQAKVLEHAVRGVVRTGRGKELDEKIVTAPMPGDDSDWRRVAVHRFSDLGLSGGITATVGKWLQLEERLVKTGQAKNDCLAASKGLELILIRSAPTSVDVSSKRESKKSAE